MLHESYHGTDEISATNIVSGAINVDLGSGEFGKGFYSGYAEHVARAWAYNLCIGRNKTPKTVKFSMSISDFFNFTILSLTLIESILERSHIKDIGAQNTFVFGKDLVWGLIVGAEKFYDKHQFKWESPHAEKFLNSNSTKREAL